MVTTNGALFALADETRREIVTRLARGPQPAGHLARGFQMSQPAVSKHLRLLRQAGLVHSRKVGRQQVYQLSPDGMTALQRILDELSRMWATALPRFKDFIDNEQPNTRRRRPLGSPSIPVLHGSVVVDASIDQAFHAFTTSLDRWCPREYHIGQAEMAEAIFEPRAGGRWYEKGVDGSECDWGQVLAWEPPHRLVVTWQINGMWQYDPDPAHASEIEVRFTAAGPNQTSVRLEHRHIERLVEAKALADGIEQQGGGWSSLLERFAAIAGAARG